MTSVAVAIGREGFESELVAALNSGSSGLQLVRRCVDAIDLAAVAVGGLAEAAIVGARLPRLDLAGIDAVLAAGVRVVGVAADELTATRLRSIGVEHVVVVPNRGAPADFEQTVHDLAAIIGTLRTPEPAVVAVPRAHDDVVGRLTVVCGPAGAPGRTTIAANLASLWGDAASPALLVDADVDAPALAPLLGVLVDESGLARAVRAVHDVSRQNAVLRHATRAVTPGVELLSGTTLARTPEVTRASAIERVMAACTEAYGHVVVDTASWRLADGYTDMSTPSSTTLLRTLLGLADDVVVVGAADPIGIVRLLEVLGQVGDVAAQARTTLVLNRSRRSALGNADAELLDVLQQHVDLPETFVVADDRASLDAAVLQARHVCELFPKSKASTGMRTLATALNDSGRTQRSEPAQSSLFDGLATRLRLRRAS